MQHPDQSFIGVKDFDATSTPDPNGTGVRVGARFLCVESAPSGAAVELAFGNQAAPRISVRAGQVIELASDRAFRDVFVFWTQVVPEVTEGYVEIELPAEEKKIRLVWAHEARFASPPDKIAVYPKAGHAFTTFQGKIAVTGEAVQVVYAGEGVECDEFRLGARPANVANLYVGGVDVDNVDDGTGTGEFLAPGEKLAYPLFNTGIVFVNGTEDDVFSVCAIHKRR